MLKIKYIEKNSIADELKIKPNDTLVSINGRDINDILDYIYYDHLENLDILIQKPNGKTIMHEISKDEPLGLEFFSDEIEPSACCNSCIFCFVDQLPCNMRDTLYFKDDDYRLSFTCGNYVTLTNITDSEIDRIIRQKISPLYISVHAADWDTRKKIIGNQNARDIMDVIKKLAGAGIAMHCQVVLCGGINDGEVLADTTKRLFEFHPLVDSLAVVPVGLTRHREGLFPLEPLTATQAATTIDFAENFNSKNNAHFIFCSDEMYQIAGKELPSSDYYGEYLQIENGVGLIRKFENEFLEELSYTNKSSDKTKSVVLVTGVSAAPFLHSLAEKFCAKHPNITVGVLPIKNEFFGTSVTVAGLVTGGDILKGIKSMPKCDKIILPKSMLKEFSTVFLDNISLDDIRAATEARVVVCPVDGGALVEKLLS